jgi:hypothetical protein
MSSFPDQWSIRIGAAQDALKRSRYAFLAATVISGAFGIAAYNEAFSWDRQMYKAIEEQAFNPNEIVTPTNKNPLKLKLKCQDGKRVQESPKEEEWDAASEEAWKAASPATRLAADQLCSIKKMRVEEVYKRWQNNISIASSLLGISLSADDTYLLGGLIISGLLMWSFYTARRENHLITELIYDVLHIHESAEKKNLLIDAVFHGISSYTVFINASR